MRCSLPGSSVGESRDRLSARRHERIVLGLLLAGLVLLAAGCSRGTQTGGPQLSPKDAANQAMKEYDTNKDGFLDAKELERCPALHGALKRIDKDNDGRLSADEIANRFTFLRGEGMANDLGVEVTLDRRALSGATVTLEPEPFMGPAFKPFSVVTDAAGLGTLKPEGSAEVSLLPPGYYRVKVSKKDAKGQEMILARYNRQTILGQEIAPDAGGGRSALTSVKLALTSK